MAIRVNWLIPFINKTGQYNLHSAITLPSIRVASIMENHGNLQSTFPVLEKSWNFIFGLKSWKNHGIFFLLDFIFNVFAFIRRVYAHKTLIPS